MNFSQGHLPSCQTLAAIGALLMNEMGRRTLQKMISRTDNDYMVTFPSLADQPIVVAAKEYATTGSAGGFSVRAIDALNKEFASEKYLWAVFPDRPHHVSGDELMLVLEIAYAKYQKLAYPERFQNVPADDPLLVYRNEHFHYQADETLRDFTGWTVETLAAGASTSDGSRSFAEQAENNNLLGSSVRDKLEGLSEHRSDYVATTCSVGHSGSKTFLDPGGKIQPWHDHIVAGVSIKDHSIHLIDPFNSRITMILRWDDFYRYFYLKWICP
jgi:hypothetical protein